VLIETQPIPLDPAEAELADERRLVERARTSPDAFGRLYDQYVERVYRYAYRRLGTHPEAEDLTAQVFHRALEALPQYEWRGLPFGAWLFRIAHNLVVDRHRARAAAPAASLDDLVAVGAEPAADTPTAAEALEAQEAGLAAWAAVKRLPPMQQRAVVLRFARDLSHAEVGAIIGRSETATKQLIYRAMLSLRARMEVE
jgi:RNA polymerase sigma-70 factor (ECF subfamily)